MEDDKIKCDSIRPDFASALIRARTKQGFNQKYLAEYSDVSPRYIAKLESPEGNPTIPQIAILAGLGFEVEIIIKHVPLPL